MTKLNDRKLNLATLPATALSVLLMGIANNHANAGAVTHALFVLVVLAFFVQAFVALRRA